MFLDDPSGKHSDAFTTLSNALDELDSHSYRLRQPSRHGPGEKAGSLQEMRNTLVSLKCRMDGIVAYFLESLDIAEANGTGPPTKLATRSKRSGRPASLQGKLPQNVKNRKFDPEEPKNGSLQHSSTTAELECSASLRQMDIAQASNCSSIAPNLRPSNKIPPSNKIRPQANESLRYHCGPDDLGPKMVDTIVRARLALGADTVDARGYFVLVVGNSWTPSKLNQILHDHPPRDSNQINGFKLARAGHDYMNAWIDTGAQKTYSQLLDAYPNSSEFPDLEGGFQNWIDNPPDHVSYLITAPPGELAKDHEINRLLHAGPRTNKRPDLPGINSPYWYVSYDEGTPATLHIEDGQAGSANLLLGGAEKHWIIIHRCSVATLEECIRQEFPRSRGCSQFVRHHNLLLGPEWLKARDIDFEIVRQKPGEMLVTVPGPTYHEVRNAGPNFAVAINYEYLGASDKPEGYIWCQKGSSKCGENALTLEDFSPTISEEARLVDRTSHATGTEVIVIPDDPDESANTPAKLAHIRLPKPVSEEIEEIESLIDTCLGQELVPHWFNCSDQNGLKDLLGMFRPGEWLNDHAVRLLLQLIACPNGYHVEESVGVDPQAPNTDAMFARVASETRGMVFPLNIGNVHWALAILEFKTLTLSTFDVRDTMADKWARAIEKTLSAESRFGLGCKVTIVSSSLPDNPDGGSCGLCCCAALENHIGTYSSTGSQKNIRARYLRRLLEAYQLSAGYQILEGSASNVVARSSSGWVESDTQEMATPDDALHADRLDPASVPEHLLQILNDALTQQSSISKEKRGRLVQMIIQCSMEEFESLSKSDMSTDHGPRVDGDGMPPRDMISVYNDIAQNSDSCIPAFRQRILYIELYLAYKRQVVPLKEERERTRKRRKRQLAAGEKVDPLPNRGQMTKTVVLDKIISSSNVQYSASQKQLRTRLETYIAFGDTLKSLADNLGLGITLALPSATVQRCDLKATFRSRSSYNCGLDPSEYHKMQGEDLKFFVQWFPKFKPELRYLKDMDLTSLFPGGAICHQIKQLLAPAARQVCLSTTTPITRKRKIR